MVATAEKAKKKTGNRFKVAIRGTPLTGWTNGQEPSPACTVGKRDLPPGLHPPVVEEKVEFARDKFQQPVYKTRKAFDRSFAPQIYPAYVIEAESEGEAVRLFQQAMGVTTTQTHLVGVEPTSEPLGPAELPPEFPIDPGGNAGHPPGRGGLLAKLARVLGMDPDQTRRALLRELKGGSE